MPITKHLSVSLWMKNNSCCLSYDSRKLRLNHAVCVMSHVSTLAQQGWCGKNWKHLWCHLWSHQNTTLISLIRPHCFSHRISSPLVVISIPSRVWNREACVSKGWGTDNLQLQFFWLLLKQYIKTRPNGCQRSYGSQTSSLLIDTACNKTDGDLKHQSLKGILHFFGK